MKQIETPDVVLTHDTVMRLRSADADAAVVVLSACRRFTFAGQRDLRRWARERHERGMPLLLVCACEAGWQAAQRLHFEDLMGVCGPQPALVGGVQR